MAYLGRLSYGMYLWHWPLWVWTGRHGWWDLTGLGARLRALVLTAPTVGLAASSYQLIESPIRYGTAARFLVPRRTLVALPVALARCFWSAAAVVPYAGAALGKT